ARLDARARELAAHARRQGQRRVEGDDRGVVDPALEPPHQHVVAKRRLGAAVVVLDLAAATLPPASPRLDQGQLVVAGRQLQPRDGGGLAPTAAEADADEAVQASASAGLLALT